MLCYGVQNQLSNLSSFAALDQQQFWDGGAAVQGLLAHDRLQLLEEEQMGMEVQRYFPKVLPIVHVPKV